MGGVILDFNPVEFAKRLDIPQSDRDLLLKEIFDSWRWPLLDNGCFDSDEEFFEKLIKPVIPQRLWIYAERLIYDWYKERLEPIPGMPELIKTLKNRGYKILLLSNAGPSHKFYWPNVKGSESFDGVIVSAYEKQFKPNLDIYQTALQKNNIKAEESIFVDNLAVNCASAYMCGITPILFINSNQLEEDLKKLNVL